MSGRRSTRRGPRRRVASSSQCNHTHTFRRSNATATYNNRNGEPLTKEEAKKQLDEQKKEQQKRIEEANKKNNEQANDPNGQQQPDEKTKANNDPMLAVRLFDEETNQPIDVHQYAREMGFRTLLVVSGARNRERGYPFWRRRYGEPVRWDADYFAAGAERVVWRAEL